MKTNSSSPSKRCSSIVRAASSTCASSFRTGVSTVTSTRSRPVVVMVRSATDEPGSLAVTGQLGLAEDEVLGGKLVLAVALDQCVQGLEQHEQVQERRAVLDVVEVVAHLPGRAVATSRIAATDLGPAGQARLHERAPLVVGDEARELLDELRGLGAGTDEAHLAAQHLGKLWQLVEMGLLEQAPHARHQL